MNEAIVAIASGVIAGHPDLVEVRVSEALQKGAAPKRILSLGLVAPMEKVGARFEAGEFFIPEMMVAAKAMKSGLEILKPYLVAEGLKPAGKVVLGTVRGDLHDIGVGLVGMMLEGAGFQVINLGTDVSPGAFVEAAREDGVNVVGLSALLTTTVGEMELAVSELGRSGVRGHVKVVVGGAPVTPEFATQIGADGTAADAYSAISLVKSLLGLK